MKRLLLPLIAALAFPTAGNAEVSDEVHKRCKDVKDYLGCVKAQSGEVKSQTSELIANTCPPRYAYDGNGFCRRFACRPLNPWRLKEPVNLRRKHACSGFNAWPDPLEISQIGVRRFERAFRNPLCPNREPGLGWGSTCDEDRGLLPETISKKKNKLPMACRNGM